MGFLEPSPTTGFVRTRPPVVEIPPSLTPSPPSDDEVDYSGDGFDFGDKPAPDTSKFSHLTGEEGEINSPTETELPPAERHVFFNVMF